MTDAELKGEERKPRYYVQPKYQVWKRWLFEPLFSSSKVTLKGWHLPHLLVWVAVGYLWQTVVESNLLRIPWWIYGWGPLLLLVFLIVDSHRFHRLMTYLGWFYILRGSRQRPVRELLMGSTAKLVVRLSNGLAFGSLFWFTDYSLFWLARVSVPWPMLLVKFFVYWIFFYLVFWAVDQWWFFRRTRMALVMTIFMWIAASSVFWFWFELTSDIVICPVWLCPP